MPVNGLITPVSHPYHVDPIVREDVTLDASIAQDFESRYAYLNEFSADRNPFWASEIEKHFNETEFPFPTEQAHKTAPFQEHLHNYAPAALETTAPPTPDLLPIRDFVSDAEETAFRNSDSKSRTDELVGMGLYDSPSSLESTTLFGGNSINIPYRSNSGKGLKLEETFQPSQSDEDEEDDDAEGEQSDTEDIEGPVIDDTVPSLSNHSFFFEHDNDHKLPFHQLTPNYDFTATSWAYPAGESSYNWI